MNSHLSPSSEFLNTGVLITGGGSGIGASLVEAFVRMGAKVAFIDIDTRASEALVSRLSTGDSIAPLFLQADLRNQSELAVAVKAAGDALGGIRVLINNAAWDDRHDIDTVTSEYWDANQAVNLKQVFFVTQAALPYLRQEEGASIINFSSISYLLNMGDLPAYTAAKAGIIGLTKSLAGRLGPETIRVNAILPGMIVTERQKDLWLTDESIRHTINRQCLKRTLTGEDLVGPCVFLASNASAAMTAQTMIIDGGLL
ncbi:NAD(P)-dependent dehydrogenase (short-subunit alcohol dehydrogenase family) [Agrobacterium larrymoorei]|uniref:NAD(P)-dependent dehydrogenase (Short-subunit alcohol dehydrogenase family) n=1 Tax=Agrobacterium larrymoorei TaxID=160699 RepID=A0AAJ2BD70_9HYPH|nr:SDR family oxidoreductase [Agrobacterium larrymoorei]MDR6104370.1 NAD(P)-dependent dehydrogenase (short-subunit alcohol dehydrogenase family) [Agrobacterium larrymoorei]